MAGTYHIWVMSERKESNMVMKALAYRVAICLSSVMPLASAALAQGGGEEPVFHVDFSDYKSDADTVRDWVAAKGFAFEKDAKDEGDISLKFEDASLHVQAETPAFGMIYRKQDIGDVSRIKLEWGVKAFPEGASYERAIHNEALMVYVFFGKDELPSGSIFVPDSPYFIGLYLCDADNVDHPYKGRYFEEGGRFVCLDRPKPGELVTSEFDLQKAFKDYFGKDAIPPVSGISLEVDTSDSGDDGRAAAFIQRIELLK